MSYIISWFYIIFYQQPGLDILKNILIVIILASEFRDLISRFAVSFAENEPFIHEFGQKWSNIIYIIKQT